ncbi:MAG: uncharacterized protein QOI42_1304 [Frankiaceae bacterium]|nr:uncharacterized protein [Frankiaceae bacterium]
MSFPNARRSRPLAPRRSLLIIVLAVVAVVILLGTTGVTLYTDGLWFRSLGFSSVWSRTLVTRIVLFVVFAVAVAGFVVGNLMLAFRLRPIFRPITQEQQALDEYRAAIQPRMRLLFTVAGVLAALSGGAFGAGHWRTWMMWRNAQPFGTLDPQFSRDIGYFAFTYPFQRMLLGIAFAIVAIAIITSAIVHYLFGGIRLQAPNGERFASGARAHLLVLLGIFALLKSVAYWLDRYGLAFSERGFVTGPSYTDVHAVLKAKTLLLFIALLCAIGIFVAAFVSRGIANLLPLISLGLLVVAAIVVGGIYPAVVQRFQVKPNEASREAPYIQRNISATRVAYGIDKVQNVSTPSSDSNAVPSITETNVANVRLLDPNVVSATFRQQQQNRNYYSFQDLLDIDRYTVGVKRQETVIAVRELATDNLQQKSWINEHVNYTHGIGVVAAPADTVKDGGPDYIEKDVPPTGKLPPFQPRIYFGENSPEYSIVGGAANSEIDYLSADSNELPVKTTYQGSGGVPIGSSVNRLAYALRFGDTNLLLSSSITGSSKILYDRAPRDRVQAAAPWLHVDGDPYPAVVDGRVLWIVDGYTTSAGYPYSETKSLGDITRDANTGSSAIGVESNEQVNYIRNSVKATVDAYDGTVTLYAWDEQDPVLKVWEHAFPGTVQPKSKMSPDLLSHVRYPEDLFKVQRDLLASYHVTDPGTFYSGQNIWLVPGEPGATTTTSATGVTTGAPDQPPYYLMLQMPGQTQPTFSLTTALVPKGRTNLAAFLSVNGDAGPDYGTIRMIELPSGTAIPGPQQVRSSMDSVAGPALLGLKQGGTSNVINGNLLTVPVQNGLLYVQPYYAQSSSGNAFPLLQRVGVMFGNRVGIGNTLAEALSNATPVTTTPGGQTVTPTPTPSGTSTTPSSTSSTPTSTPSSTGGASNETIPQAVAALSQAQTDAAAALQKNPVDWTAFGDAQARIQRETDVLKRLASSLPTPSASRSG